MEAEVAGGVGCLFGTFGCVANSVCSACTFPQVHSPDVLLPISSAIPLHVMHRPPLLELPLERFLPAEMSTPKPNKHSATHTLSLKRPHSPAASWLSPSKRRILLPEHVLSPVDRTPALPNPARRLFADDEPPSTMLVERPVRRSLFPQCDLPHPLFPGRAPSEAMRSSLAQFAKSRDDPDTTLVSSSSLPSSPITRNASPVKKHVPYQSCDVPSTPPPLAPSPEIKPPSTAMNTVDEIPGEATRDPYSKCPPTTPILTYSSNPNIPTSSALKRRRKYVTSSTSRHYPGFDIPRDNPPLSSSSTLHSLSSGSATQPPPNDEGDDSDKENAFCSASHHSSHSTKRPGRGSKRKSGSDRAGNVGSDPGGCSDDDVTPRKRRAPNPDSRPPSPSVAGKEREKEKDARRARIDKVAESDSKSNSENSIGSSGLSATRVRPRLSATSFGAPRESPRANKDLEDKKRVLEMEVDEA